jgi:hypothetical protein
LAERRIPRTECDDDHPEAPVEAREDRPVKHMSRLMVAGLIVIVLCPAANAVKFYGAAEWCGARGGCIYEIDTTAQTAPLVFDPIDHSWMGAADSAIPNCFYGTVSLIEGSLYLINVVEQTAMPVGPFVAATISELAYDDVAGVVYGTDCSNLYTIDQTTGLATLVGSFNGPIDMFALAYDSAQGKLFGVNGGIGSFFTVYEIDTTTGSATEVGPTGDYRIQDIWYDSSDGSMYGVGDAPNQVYSIDTTTGAATPLFAIEPIIWGLGKPVSLNPVESGTWGCIKSLFR